MNETLSILLSRRSIRGYKDTPVPQEIVEQVMEAGLYAPSARGKQSPIIVEFSDPKITEELRKDNAEVGGMHGHGDPFYGAPVILAVLVPEEAHHGIEDGSVCIGNMLNAVQALGLRGIWISRARPQFEMSKWKDFLTSIGVRDNYVGVGFVAMGYPAVEDPVPAKRNEGRIYRVIQK
ncbi:MAG: nitroreductase family protein [Candidatus Enteromonas sp.]|nr:nitroreductase family protein [Candidatus Enteromonas sp.]